MAPLVFLLLFGQILLCTGVDTINSTTPLSGSQKIVSQGSKFTLGFYSPTKPQSKTISSTSGDYYYIGIWYSTVPLLTPVWTAITDVLVSDPTTASLEISKDGNLVLRDQAKNRQLWSTSISISSNSTIAIIRDSGSLELTDASNSSMVYWRSIDHPTDTWLPGAKLGLNKITGVSKRLVSRKNSADPSPGLFSMELDPNGTTQLLIQWNESVNYWTSGVWNYLSHMPEFANNLLDFQFVSNAAENYLFYSMKNNDSIVSRFNIYQSGQIMLNICVKGFSQKVQSDWDLQDYSGGCKRNTPLQCQTNSTSAQAQSDKFYVMTDVRLPDNARGAVAKSSQECQVACLNNCSCTAYAYNHARCFVWHGDLINLQEQYSGTRGGTLLLRLAASELPDQQRMKTRISGSVVGGVAAFLLILAITLFFLFHHCRRDRTLRISKNAGAALTDFRYNDLLDDIRSIDSLLLDLSTLRVATNDFGEGNMLGKGGFGMVHKIEMTNARFHKLITL